MLVCVRLFVWLCECVVVACVRCCGVVLLCRCDVLLWWCVVASFLLFVFACVSHFFVCVFVCVRACGCGCLLACGRFVCLCVFGW